MFFLSGCDFGQNSDPFAQLPNEELATISGEIFPFALSVSTQATHRLEADRKLVALLASDIVRLEDFEGKDVELEGVYRKEKMREIFWVQKIRIKNVLAPESELKYERFETKNYTFTYPKEWEYTTAADGTVRFIEKADEARRVFFTFGVGQVEHRDKRSDPNVLIANLAGIKKTRKDELDRDRQEIVLFSNISDRKYSFEFISTFEEFDKKKYFFQLLNSFLEGEENVVTAKDEDLRKLASLESAKVITYEEVEIPEEKPVLKAETPEAIEVITEDEGNDIEESLPESLEPKAEEKGLFERIFGSSDENETIEVIEPIQPVETETIAKTKPGNFKNLLDDRAYLYDSEYFGLSVKIPYGYWFQNFGSTDDALLRLGIAKKSIESEADPIVWLKIKNGAVSGFSEKCNDKCVIAFKRDNKTLYEITGGDSYRDLMLSILSSL